MMTALEAFLAAAEDDVVALRGIARELAAGGGALLSRDQDQCNAFVLAVFNRRFGWGEHAPVTGPESIAIATQNDSALDLSLRSLDDQQLHDVVAAADAVLGLLLRQPLNAALLTALRHVALACHSPLVRGQTYRHLYDWLKALFPTRSSPSVDERLRRADTALSSTPGSASGSSRDAAYADLDALFDVVHALILMGVTDLWSAIRKQCSAQLSAAAGHLTLAQLERLWRALVEVASSADETWQAREGATRAMTQLIKKFTWVAGLRMSASSSMDSPSSAAATATAAAATTTAEQPRSQANRLMFVQETLTALPAFITRDMRPVLFALLGHDQRSIRETATSAFAAFLSRSPFEETMSCFMEATARLRPVDKGQHAADFGVGAYEAEGLIGLCIVLVKLIPTAYLLPHWSESFAVFSALLAHPASSVRQASSDVFKFIVTRDASNARLFKLVLQSLAAGWPVDWPATRLAADGEGNDPPWEWKEGRLLAYENVVTLLVANHHHYVFPSSARHGRPSTSPRAPSLADKSDESASEAEDDTAGRRLRGAMSVAYLPTLHHTPAGREPRPRVWSGHSGPTTDESEGGPDDTSEEARTPVLLRHKTVGAYDASLLLRPSSSATSTDDGDDDGGGDDDGDDGDVDVDVEDGEEDRPPPRTLSRSASHGSRPRSQTSEVGADGAAAGGTARGVDQRSRSVDADGDEGGSEKDAPAKGTDGDGDVIRPRRCTEADAGPPVLGEPPEAAPPPAAAAAAAAAPSSPPPPPAAAAAPGMTTPSPGEVKYARLQVPVGRRRRDSFVALSLVDQLQALELAHGGPVASGGSVAYGVTWPPGPSVEQTPPPPTHPRGADEPPTSDRLRSSLSLSLPLDASATSSAGLFSPADANDVLVSPLSPSFAAAHADVNPSPTWTETWWRSVQLLPTSEILSAVLQQTAACIVPRARWELRRMADQVMPPLVDVLLLFDATLLTTLWSSDISDASVAVATMQHALRRAGRLSRLLSRPAALALWSDRAVRRARAVVRAVSGGSVALQPRLMRICRGLDGDDAPPLSDRVRVTAAAVLMRMFAHPLPVPRRPVSVGSESGGVVSRSADAVAALIAVSAAASPTVARRVADASDPGQPLRAPAAAERALIDAVAPLAIDFARRRRPEEQARLVPFLSHWATVRREDAAAQIALVDACCAALAGADGGGGGAWERAMGSVVADMLALVAGRSTETAVLTRALRAVGGLCDRDGAHARRWTAAALAAVAQRLLCEPGVDARVAAGSSPVPPDAERAAAAAAAAAVSGGLPLNPPPLGSPVGGAMPMAEADDDDDDALGAAGVQPPAAVPDGAAPGAPTTPAAAAAAAAAAGRMESDSTDAGSDWDDWDEDEDDIDVLVAELGRFVAERARCAGAGERAGRWLAASALPQRERVVLQWMVTQ